MHAQPSSYERQRSASVVAISLVHIISSLDNLTARARVRPLSVVTLTIRAAP